MCQLFGLANWLRAALFFGLGLTETSWCHSKIQVSDLPCGFLWGGPIKSFSLVSNPFYLLAKVPQSVTKGLLQSLLGFSPPQAQQAGVVLGSDEQCWGRWNLPFHCLERSFSGLTLLSLILVLCNSITLVRLPPDLCHREWISPWAFCWTKYDVTLFLDIIMCWFCNR